MNELVGVDSKDYSKKQMFYNKSKSPKNTYGINSHKPQEQAKLNEYPERYMW